MTEQEQPAQSLSSFIVNQRKKFIRPITPNPTNAGPGTTSQDEVLASIFDTLLSSQDSHAHPSPPTVSGQMLQGATSSSYYCDCYRAKLARLGGSKGVCRLRRSPTLAGDLLVSNSLPAAPKCLGNSHWEWVSARGTGLLGATLQGLPRGVRSSLSG